MKVIEKETEDKMTLDTAYDRFQYFGYIWQNKPFHWACGNTYIGANGDIVVSLKGKPLKDDILNHLRAGADVHAFNTSKELHHFLANSLT